MTETSKTRKRTSGRRRTQRFAQMLLRVTNEVAASASLDQALATLVDITTSTIGAERGTIFLHDRHTRELYSRVAQGNLSREIRILDSVGVAGWVFTRDEGAIIPDAYADERFSPDVDRRTGFKTRNILCAPLRNLRGEKIGVTQVLNKLEEEFTQADLDLLQAMTEQAAVALEGSLIVEEIEQRQRQEQELLDVVANVSSEIQLGALLSKIIATISKMLDAERSTLFINDDKANELYTEVGEGLGKSVIRFPNHIGIAGTVFVSGETVNIPHAYADLRFNPAFDRQTGFFTRSILCAPVRNKAGKTVGVTQVLNKRGGPFTAEDESRLAAFTSQISIAVENAKLFDDVQNMKNYNESMLESMSNGVITIDENGHIVTCNRAALQILNMSEQDVVRQAMGEFFTGANAWIPEHVQRVNETGEEAALMDTEIAFEADTISANVTIVPLISVKQERLGAMIMIEDISTEKRMKSTMSRYMNPELAARLMEEGQDILGGAASTATVLFSDVRGFTPLTEALGAQGIVHLLNEYFTRMVECISVEGGMLDKFIGDAIMAVFGTPVAHDDDPDRAVRAAIGMMTALNALNAQRITDGKPPIDHRIGLNTDAIISGNIGSPKRMDYTVMGDGVNLASRLESACKQYGTKVLMSEFTFHGLKATYRTREVDRVVVKGKSQPVSVYELLDYHTPETFPNMVEALGHFHDGLDYYRQARWDDAIGAFRAAASLNPNDRVCTVYIARCETLRASPPEGEWDGIWVLKEK